MEIFGSLSKEKFSQNKFTFNYNKDYSNNIPLSQSDDIEYYHRFIEVHIFEIFKFLDSDFDYEMHEKELILLKKKIEEDKASSLEKLGMSIETTVVDSIKIVLKYYSEISDKLENYLKLYMVINNKETPKNLFS